MATLATLFKGSSTEEEVSDKLLNLFQKRVELKKEFAGLRKTQYRLQDRVKIEEGNSARVKQELDRLEAMLLDPKNAPSVLAGYQLRGLAIRCQRKLAKFSEQLKQQREQRIHNQQLADWNKQRLQDGRVVENQLAAVRADLAADQSEHDSFAERLLLMNGFLKLLKRRSMARELNRLQQQIAAGEDQVQKLVDSLQTVQTRQPPVVGGLDTASKRNLNLMIISYAQELLLNFSDDTLADMARDACEHGVGAINYGTRKECNELVDRVENCMLKMTQSTESSDIIMKRSKLIAEHAVFRSDSEVVPKAASVSTLYAFRPDGEIVATSADILGQNYWEIASVLSR